MTSSPTANGGTILLVLASRDVQNAAQLAAASHLSPADTIQQLYRLTEQGFIIASSPDATGVSVYRLNPKGIRTEGVDLHERILVVDDADALRRLIQVILEGEGYVVIATAVQANAVALLQEVTFDLVLTDSFSAVSSGALIHSAELLAAAGATPVALFPRTG